MALETRALLLHSLLQNAAKDNTRIWMSVLNVSHAHLVTFKQVKERQAVESVVLEISALLQEIFQSNVKLARIRILPFVPNAKSVARMSSLRAQGVLHAALALIIQRPRRARVSASASPNLSG